MDSGSHSQVAPNKVDRTSSMEGQKTIYTLASFRPAPNITYPLITDAQLTWRDAEGLKDKIKRKKDGLADTS